MAYEDFTGYSEVDPNNRFSQTTTRNTWAGLTGDETAYVYKDYTADHFGDFEHAIDTFLDAATGDGETYSTYAGTWAVSNSSTSPYASQNSLFVTWLNFWGLQIRLTNRTNWSNTTDTYAASLDTAYYLTIERATTALTCKIYSDSARTNLLDTLSVACNETTYQYLHCGWSADTNGLESTDGYNEKLDLSPGAPPPAAQFMVPKNYW